VTRRRWQLVTIQAAGSVEDRMEQKPCWSSSAHRQHRAASLRLALRIIGARAAVVALVRDATVVVFLSSFWQAGSMQLVLVLDMLTTLRPVENFLSVLGLAIDEPGISLRFCLCANAAAWRGVLGAYSLRHVFG
jgi:hypothetical protein